MYHIKTHDKLYSNLTEAEFVTIRSVLDYNRIQYKWKFTNI